MSDNAISTGIMSTASIITTIIIVAATFTVAVTISSSIQQNGDNLVTQTNREIDIIAIGEVYEGNETFYIYVKNTGVQSIPSFAYLDVIIDGAYMQFENTDPLEDRWNATIVSDFNSNGVWDVDETIAIRAMFASGNGLRSGFHKIIVSVSGSPEQFLFSI